MKTCNDRVERRFYEKFLKLFCYRTRNIRSNIVLKDSLPSKWHLNYPKYDIVPFSMKSVKSLQGTVFTGDLLRTCLPAYYNVCIPLMDTKQYIHQKTNFFSCRSIFDQEVRSKITVKTTNTCAASTRHFTLPSNTGNTGLCPSTWSQWRAVISCGHKTL